MKTKNEIKVKVTKRELVDFYNSKKRILREVVDGVEIKFTKDSTKFGGKYMKCIHMRIDGKLKVCSDILLSYIPRDEGDSCFEEIMDWLDDNLAEAIKDKKENEKALARWKRKKAKHHYEYFDYNGIDVLLKRVIDKSYYGREHTAWSGSTYTKINGKEVRFADHGRQLGSKWNDIYGDAFIEPPGGFLRKKTIRKFIENELGIENCDREKLKKAFNRE